MLFGDALGNEPPDIDAVSWFEADVAAAEGSNDPPSRPSWMVLGRCVGELFFGVEPRNNFLEKVRVRLVFSGAG